MVDEAVASAASVAGRTMRAAVIAAARQVRVLEVPIPALRDDDVLVRVTATGICGTDVAVYAGAYPARLPVTMGHEFAGVVAAVGPSVDDLQVGRRVIGEGSWPVGGSGKPADIARLGRSVDGCFAEYVRVPRRAVHTIPDGVSDIAAQSVTTVATAVHAADRSGALRGRRVAIVGPGHAGLLLLQVVRDRGAAAVTMLGRRHGRLELARRLGAGAGIDVGADTYGAWRHAHADGFDVVFEASGTTAGLATCFDLVAHAGTVVVYGIISGDLSGVPGLPLYAKELNVVGSSGGDEDYARAIELVERGAVTVEPLVTSALSLDEVPEGMARAADRTTEDVRIVFRPAGP